MFVLLMLALQLPSYVQRGDQVEARYREYAADFHDYDAKLRSALMLDAPDLAEQLKETPVPPLQFGYQILPPLLQDEPAAALQSKAPKLLSTSYSWPRTQGLIDAEAVRVASARQQLSEIRTVQADERRSRYKTLVEMYPDLSMNQKRIEEHVQYNRFWQKEIAADRSRFDRQTALYDALLAGQPAVAKLADGFAPPHFLKVNRAPDGQWVITVPTYTDIADSLFLNQAKQGIERVWQVHTAALNARVQVEFMRIKMKNAPAQGTHIDIENHVKQFPADGAVLTTGANSTHAIIGRYIALGAAGIPPHVIAHEFGHILGFADGYFRGYRALPEDGFEVLEIIPNPDDIMCAPGTGHVLEDHFRLLLGQHLNR